MTIIWLSMTDCHMTGMGLSIGWCVSVTRLLCDHHMLSVCVVWC